MAKDNINVVDHINSLINMLKTLGIKIYDSENREFCIDNIEYSREDDLLVANFQEDNSSCPGSINPYDTVIKLAADNSNMKQQIESFTQLNHELVETIKVMSERLSALESENKN